jgi:CRP/FNR family transcriptional regulator, cyclic AMP receptor protein
MEQHPDSPPALRRIELFALLEDAMLESIWTKLTHEPLRSGDVLDHIAIGPRMGFAWSGQYRVVLEGPNESELSIGTVKPGGHFGDIPTFAGIPDLSYKLVVDQPGLVLLLERNLFLGLVASSPALCQAVLRSLALACVLRADRLFEFAMLDVRMRLMAELWRLSLDGASRDGKITISHPPTHQALAAQVGTTREGVTRHLRALARQGLISARRSAIEILRPEELRLVVESVVGARPTYARVSRAERH